MHRKRLGAAWALPLALGVVACAQDARVPPTKSYLQQAQVAVGQRNRAEALASLDRAESLWISHNVPFSSPFFTFDPEALRDIARAKQSIDLGRWDDANYYVSTALRDPSILTP